MKKIVVLSGAGISAESGIKTFRDSDGLWEGYDVMEVASPQGWFKNKALVLDFYNQRRKNNIEAQPNKAHLLLAELEKNFDVQIITQNVDNLHERAGSTNVFHLHGQLNQSKSTKNPNLIYEIIGSELNIGDKCELGSQLRPNIVWFGEPVPEIKNAAKIVQEADILLVVGTSLVVYPAAGLLDYAPEESTKYIIDPIKPEFYFKKNFFFIEEKATIGIKKFIELILSEI